MDWILSLDLVLVLRVVVAALGGLAIGFCGSMIGGGLGRLRLLLVYWTARSPADAAGTSNLIQALANGTGTWKHLRDSRVNFSVVALIGIPASLGAFLGGFFGGLAPRGILLIVVGIISIWYGYTLLTGTRGGHWRGGDNPSLLATEGSTPANKLTLMKVSVRRYLMEMGLGLIIGLFGGAVGMALGQFRLAAMIRVLGMDPRVVAGTNLAIGALVGLFGFSGHILHLEADWAVAATMGPMSMLGSYLGARYTGKMSPQTVLRWMGGVMVVTSLPLFWLAYTQL
jgi:uncharacterized membrane protein YfcA